MGKKGKNKKKKKTAHRRRREADRRWFRKKLGTKPKQCADCQREGVPLQFHHVRYDIPRTGRYICNECHMKVHGFKPNNNKRKMRENNKYRNNRSSQNKRYKEE